MSLSYTTKTVRLPDGLASGGELQFLEAVLFQSPPLPFAIVHYSLDGTLEGMGLRLDLDKQVFLDHFPDTRTEEIASAAASEIVSFLGTRGDALSAAAHAY